MSLPPAPAHPFEDEVRILVDGDLCDTRGCPAVAYVRVYMYQPGTRELLGSPLHWCGYHWRPVADKLVQAAMDGKCSIHDEREWLARYSR